MGDTLHKISGFVDPIGNKLTHGKNDLGHDLLTPKTGAPPPAYDPTKNPGAHLFQPPPGGPPSAPGGPPGGGGPSGSGLFGAPQTQPGYAPNPWEAAVGAGTGGGQPPPTPVGPSMPGAYRPGMPQPQVSAGPPLTANGNQGMPPGGPQNPQLQQQMAIAQMLRGNTSTGDRMPFGAGRG